jgi:class 3 adenylate cyclase
MGEARFMIALPSSETLARWIETFEPGMCVHVPCAVDEGRAIDELAGAIETEERLGPGFHGAWPRGVRPPPRPGIQRASAPEETDSAPDPAHETRLHIKRAALAMRRGIEELSARRRDRGEPTARFGIGIHTGEVVLGTIGIPERSDFTALGDTVNTASRLESLTKEYAVEIVVSEAVASRLRDGEVKLRRLGDAHVRGRAATVPVYSLEG